MNAYRVDYAGLWMGGTAVVLASTHEEASALARTHPLTLNFDKGEVRVEDLGPIDEARVLYNANGDY